VQERKEEKGREEEKGVSAKREQEKAGRSGGLGVAGVDLCLGIYL